MNTEVLRTHFREDNERTAYSLTHCLDESTCSPEQKVYIQQIAQSIFAEMREIQGFLIEHSEHTSQ